MTSQENYYERQQFTHHRKKKFIQLRSRDYHQVPVNARPCSRCAVEINKKKVFVLLRLGLPSTLNCRKYGA